MTPRHFAWQAWHLVTSSFVSHGRRGTWRHPPFVFTWQAVALGAHPPGVLRGRRGTWGTGLAAGDAAALCVPGIALHLVTPRLRFTWQAWHLVTSSFRFTWQAWHLATSTFVLRGRRGTWGTGLALVARLVPGLVAGDAAALCVAGVALGDIQLRFTWQAWHLATSTFVLCGSRGTYGTGLDLVARLGPLYSPVTRRHLAWQAWHLDTIFHPTIFHTQLCRRPPSFTTPSFTHNFVTHHLSPHHLSHHIVTHHLSHTTLSHALFHTQLSHTHTPSFTQNFVIHTIFLCHTPSFTYNFVTHTALFYFSIFPPPPLSFLPSPSPLQHLVLMIGKKCLVGLSGPLIHQLRQPGFRAHGAGV